jgi:hypothetical protein
VKDKTKAKERPKDVQPIRTKKKERALVLLVVGIYFTHNPFHVAYMQIMRSNSNRRPKINISYQPIFLSIVEAKHVEKQ